MKRFYGTESRWTDFLAFCLKDDPKVETRKVILRILHEYQLYIFVDKLPVHANFWFNLGERTASTWELKTCGGGKLEEK